MAHPSITTAVRIPIEGLVTSTWCFRIVFDVEILSSPLLSSKVEVGTADSSYFNMSFRLISLSLPRFPLSGVRCCPQLVLINSATLANFNPKSYCSIVSTPRFFEFLQLGLYNLNSVFNIDICVANLPGDNDDTILASGDIKGIHTLIQLVSDNIHVILSALIIEGHSSLWWSTSTKVAYFKSAMSVASLEHICPAAKSMLVQRISPGPAVPHKCCLNIQQHRNRASHD